LSFAVRVAPDGATPVSILLDTVRVWRYAVCHVVDYCITRRQTSLAKVHRALYRLLRKRYGLPARLATDAIRQGIWIAKGWLKNPRRGRRPVIKRLWMVLTSKSYSFKGRDEVSVLTLDGRRSFKLVYVERWHGRYRDWKPKEARLVVKDGRIWLKVVVEKDIPLVETEGFLGVDVNYANVTLSDGTRIEIPAFKRAHGLRIEAERIQKRHGKRWRYVKDVRHRIRALHARSRNVIIDACRKVGLEVARRAYEARKTIVLEDLTGLRNSVNRKSQLWRVRLSLWAYRELQKWIVWKARLYGVPVLVVNPRGTSSTCPKCGARLAASGGRRLRCTSCGFEEDRDLIAAMNLEMRGAQAALMPPKADATPRSDAGGVRELGGLQRFIYVMKGTRGTINP